MRAIGLIVGWSEAVPAFPLILHGIPNTTSFTPWGNTVPSSVIVRDGLEDSTLPAWLPPFPVSEYATRMDALMSERINQLKVLDSVIDLDAVAMMDPEARRDVAAFAF